MSTYDYQEMIEFLTSPLGLIAVFNLLVATADFVVKEAARLRRLKSRKPND